MSNSFSTNPIQEFDIVVIGSGPAGATTARFAAANGLSVLLVDKKQELGAPIQCSGAVSQNALEQTGVIPSIEYILEDIYGFAIYNEKGEKKVFSRPPSLEGEGPGVRSPRKSIFIENPASDK